MPEALAALKAEPASSLEFRGNKQPKCPHCGQDVDISDNDLWRLYDRGCWPATVPPGADPSNYTDGYCKATHWMPLPSPPPSTHPQETQP